MCQSPALASGIILKHAEDVVHQLTSRSPMADLHPPGRYV